MEMTENSTLPVPEIAMRGDPAEAIQFCFCGYRTRLTPTHLPGADIDLMITSDSPTAWGVCFDAYQANELSGPFVPDFDLCQLRRFMPLYGHVDIPISKEASPSPGWLVMDVHRFFEQAAISCGCLSATMFSPLQAPQVALLQGVLPRWLRSIADDDMSRPIIEAGNLGQFWGVPFSSGERLLWGSEEHQIPEQPAPGALPGYVQEPLGKVRISKYPEPEEFDRNTAEPKVPLALEGLYETATGNVSCFEVHVLLKQVEAMTRQIFSGEVTYTEKEDGEVPGDWHFTFNVVDHGDVDAIQTRNNEWHRRSLRTTCGGTWPLPSFN